MKAFVSALFFLFYSTFCWSHGYHVSITQIDYNEQTQSLEITLKLITDDVEYVLQEQIGTEKLFLGADCESKNADNHIQSYLNKNFKVTVNNEIREFDYIGKEVEDNNTWCYLEIKNIENISEIEITNRIFIETYHNQVNRVNLTISGKTNSLVLSSAKISDKVVY